MQSLITGLGLFFGEFIIIGAEMMAARYFSTSPEKWKVFMYAFGASVVASALLVFGYTYGYQAFKNIWIVTAISISGILVVEPIVAILLFKELPTLGAGIAFVLAIIGIIMALVLK